MHFCYLVLNDVTVIKQRRLLERFSYCRNTTFTILDLLSATANTEQTVNIQYFPLNNLRNALPME